MVAQIDEQQPAVVAFGMYPAGQAGSLTCVGRSKCAAGVRAVGVHGNHVLTNMAAGRRGKHGGGPPERGRKDSARAEGQAQARFSSEFGQDNRAPTVIASEAKQSPYAGDREIASSLRSSQ
jgi:hypothetical protein